MKWCYAEVGSYLSKSGHFFEGLFCDPDHLRRLPPLKCLNEGLIYVLGILQAGRTQSRVMMVRDWILSKYGQ